MNNRSIALLLLWVCACDTKPETTRAPPQPPATAKPSSAPVPSPAPAPAPAPEGSRQQVRIGGADTDEQPRLAFRITTVYEQHKPDGVTHSAGGEWTFFDAELADGTRFTFGWKAKSAANSTFAFGDAWITTPDRKHGEAFVSAFAKAFKVKAPPRGPQKPLAPLQFGLAILGQRTERDPGGGFGGSGTWTATKLFPAANDKDGEVFFNFSLAAKTGELAEKDSDYNEDVAAIWAIGLRDGATPAKPKGK